MLNERKAIGLLEIYYLGGKTMAKQPCAVCGKSLGTWSAFSYTEERQPMCNRCQYKTNIYFGSIGNHTLAKYYEHLQQIEESNRIYELLLKPRINLKQDDEDSPLKKILKKHNTDEKVKKYGGSLWAIEEFGLILFTVGRYGRAVKRGEDGRRNLVFRYSDLVSYSYSKEIVSASDDTILDLIHLTFKSSYVVNEISTAVYDKVVYQAFDDYFKSIIHGDKMQWDILADEALRKAGISRGE